MQPTQTNTETPKQPSEFDILQVEYTNASWQGNKDRFFGEVIKRARTLERELAEAKESIERMENETICDCGEVYYCAENDNYYCGKCHCGMGNTYYELRKQSDQLRTENEALRKQVEELRVDNGNLTSLVEELKARADYFSGFEGDLKAVIETMNHCDYPHHPEYPDDSEIIRRLGEMAGQRDTLRAQLSAAQKDKERLDELLRQCSEVNKLLIGNFYLPETREGIDSAITAQKKD